MNLKIKKATEEEIYSHLLECDKNFNPPLSTRVDLHKFSKKIYTQSITFEAWENKKILGLVCAYLNDENTNSGFITHIGVLPQYVNQGIATTLLKSCITYANNHGFIEIKLEVSKNNKKAIHLYEKLGFIGFKDDGEYFFMKKNSLS